LDWVDSSFAGWVLAGGEFFWGAFLVGANNNNYLNKNSSQLWLFDNKKRGERQWDV